MLVPCIGDRAHILFKYLDTTCARLSAMELTSQNFVSSGLRSQRSHIVEKFCVLITDFSFTVYTWICGHPPDIGVTDKLVLSATLAAVQISADAAVAFALTAYDRINPSSDCHRYGICCTAGQISESLGMRRL